MRLLHAIAFARRGLSQSDQHRLDEILQHGGASAAYRWLLSIGKT